MSAPTPGEQIEPVKTRTLPIGNSQRLYRFDNGFGASVVQGPYTYGGDAGLSELAVLRITGDDLDDWEITYDTLITDDVIGWLDEEAVQATLGQIAALPAAPS